MDATSVIRNYNRELVTKLPLDNEIFLSMLKEANLLSFNYGESIRQLPTRSEKVAYYLQHAIEPGAEDILPILLNVMKKCNDLIVRKLADDMQAALKSDNKDNQLVKKHMSDENENTTVSVATTFAHSSTETFTHNDSNTHNAVSSHTDMNTCGDRKRYHSSQIREKKQKYDNFAIRKEIICKRYKHLIEIMDPSRISQLLVEKKLLGQNEFKAIEVAPSQYAKIAIILEHLRYVDIPSLCSFCNELKTIPSQQPIGSSILYELQLIFSDISSDDQGSMHYDCTENFVAEFEFITCNDFSEFHCCFLNFIDCLCTILKPIPNVVEILIRTCRELMASSNSSEKIELFPSDYLQALSQCRHVTALLRMLTPCMSWYNHFILNPLVESCECSEASDLIDKFDNWIQEKCILTLPILEPFSTMIPDRNSNYTILTIAFNKDCPQNLQLKYINEVASDMVNKFGITKYSLHLLAIIKKPMIFFWMVLKSLVPLIIKQLQNQSCKEYFKKKCWSEISIYPDTLFMFNNCIQVGSLTYLEYSYSEKWDYDIKSQLMDIKRLPQVLVTYRQEFEAIRKNDFEKDLLHEKFEEQNKTILELNNDARSFKVEIECSNKENQHLTEEMHRLQKEDHCLKEENQFLKAEIQRLRQTASTRTQTIEPSVSDVQEEPTTMNTDKLMDNLKSKYKHQELQLYKELSFHCCKPENATTELVDLKELFAPLEGLNSRLPERILIEGHPGIGKSKLCKAICLMWAEGKILENELVILLPLSNSDVQEISDTGALINYIVSSNKLTQVNANYLDSTNIQNFLTIIIDGFDKLSDTLRRKSFFRDLIERKVLPSARVLVTARPYALVSLHCVVDKIFDKIFKVTGFTSLSKQQYIGDALNGSPNQEKLVNHLKQHPSIDNLCNNPLCLSILCSLDIFPHTATEMYTNIVLKTMQHGSSETEGHVECKIIDDLPQPTCKILEELEKLAYNGIFQNKTSFSVGDLLDVCRTDPSCYGLLQSTEYCSGREFNSQNMSFQFTQSGMQEYFAARYVTRFSPEEISYCLKKDFIQSHKQSNLWIYFFGITGANSSVLEQYLFYEKNKSDHELNSHIKDALKCPDFVLYLFKCVQEAQDDKMCARLADYFEHDFVITDYMLEHSKMTCLGFFLSRSNKYWNKLCLDNCIILDQGVYLLHSYLKCNSNVTINTISICNNKLTTRSSSHIADIFKCCKTKYAMLSHNKICLKAIEGAVTTLERLELTDTGITAEEAKALPEFMKYLTELYIDSNQLKDKGTVLISAAICTSKVLKILDISKNDITSEGATAMANALIVNKSLETLLIGYNAIGFDGSDAFANAINQEILLKTLSFNGDDTINYRSASQIIDSIDKNDNVCSLCFPDTIPVDDRRRLISKMYKINDKRAKHRALLQIQFSEDYNQCTFDTFYQTIRNIWPDV